MFWHELFLASTSIFVAMDIIGAIPIYLTLTRDFSAQERKKIVNSSMEVAFLVALVFVFVGQTILRVLGVSIFDFKIAGGIILLLISLADLLGGPERIHQNASGSTGIVPLAVPLITGPAVFAAILLFVGSYGYQVTIAALLLNYGASWILLRNCTWIQQKIGKDGAMVLSKMAALLLTAIAISMIRSGVFESIGAFQSGF